MYGSNGYLKYLMDKVGADQRLLPLCRKLNQIEFIYDESIPTDVNREYDGLDQRIFYRNETGKLSGMESLGRASVLEVLVALAVRIDLDIMGEPGLSRPDRWFELMLNNLSLKNGRNVDGKVELWLTRTFPSTGEGSLFPLKRCPYNQRYISIWDQMSEYMVENVL